MIGADARRVDERKAVLQEIGLRGHVHAVHTQQIARIFLFVDVMGQFRLVHLLDDAVEKADAAGRFAVADLRRRRRDGDDAGGQQFFAQQRVHETAFAPFELADDRDRDALVLQLFLQRGSPCGLRAQDLGRRQQFLRFFYVF